MKIIQDEADLNEIRIWLIHVWQDLFKTTAITSNDDFFELGADSLTAIKLMSKIENKYGAGVISIDTLFAESKLEALSQAISKGQAV